MPIEGRALSKLYSDVRAIDEVDVSIPERAITAIIGENGAGKTTLLGLLSGVIAPTSGSISGRPSKISYIDQDPALDPEMTGAEHLRLMAALYGVALEEDRFGLQKILSRRIATWSGGQKRRLHIACGLLHAPDAIFLDEPTAGLDAEGARFFWAEMARRAQNASVIVVGHDLREIEHEASNVIILARGKVAGAGKPAELIAQHGRTWLRVTYKDGRREWIEGELSSLEGNIEDVEVHQKDLASVQRTLTR